MVAVKFWACSKQSHKGRRGGWALAGRSKEAGGRHAHPRGRRMDAQVLAIGGPVKNACCCIHCLWIWAMFLSPLYHHCASFSRPVASIEQSLWRPLCLQSATIATLKPPWQWFCLHSAATCTTCCAIKLVWWFKERTRRGSCCSRFHRNRTFWVWAITEGSGQFSGR